MSVPAEPWIADELAALLTSGMAGPRLLGELSSRFAQATRYEVFLGAALAVSHLEGERVSLLLDARIAEAERNTLRAERDALAAEIAKLKAPASA